MSVRVRIAPSPTGFFHIGTARTSLFNWLFARRHGGQFILRIEDTDRQRSKPEFEQQIMDAMTWLGLDWDEGPSTGGPHGPYRQSERDATYNPFIEQLIERGLAYRCDMTTTALDALREAQKARGETPRYDRRNRDKNLGPDIGDHVVRVKMPTEGAIVVDDLVKGPVTFDAEQLDDWIIRRSDGSPTYNFVVVVDDHLMNITHVIRGDDHLNNTPKQQVIYQLMGWDLPKFAHLPLILDYKGRKLSKRQNVIKTLVHEHREDGILAEALVNYLTRLGWAHGEMEEFSTDESAAVFTLEAINKTGARWDMDKLMWLNQRWIQRLPIDELAKRVQPFFEKAGVTVDERLPAVLTSLQERSQTLVDFVEKGRFYFIDDDAVEHDPAAVKKFLKVSTGPLLRALIAELEPLEDWTEDTIQAVVDRFLAEKELKLGKIAQPIRVSLTGSKIGPGLYETLVAIGKDHAIARLVRGAALCEARAQRNQA
ncbi:MAG: glutamate--tRNA ligase [Myxococcota bacterium]